MFYVLAWTRTDRSDGAPWVLDLDGHTAKDASERLIRWMQTDPEGSYEIVTASHRSGGSFVASDGTTYKPESGPYTLRAWGQFLARVFPE